MSEQGRQSSVSLCDCMVTRTYQRAGTDIPRWERPGGAASIGFHGHTPGVGVEIWDNQCALLPRDLVSFRGRRPVGSLDHDLGLDSRRVVSGQLILEGFGDQYGRSRVPRRRHSETLTRHRESRESIRCACGIPRRRSSARPPGSRIAPSSSAKATTRAPCSRQNVAAW